MTRIESFNGLQIIYLVNMISTMINYSNMWLDIANNKCVRYSWKYKIEATYEWKNQRRLDFYDWITHNIHTVTLPKDADADQLDSACDQCITEMALENYDIEKFSLIPSTPFDSETVWIISIVLLLASMVFGVLWIFVYAFVRMCIMTFITWIIIGIYAMSIKYKEYK